MVDSLAELNFSNWLLKSTSPQSQSRMLDYSSWFSESMASARVGSVCAGCKAGGSRADAENEARSAVVLYSLLIYHICPNLPALRKKIGATPGLRSNFKRIKAWLDSNGGGRIAKDFYREMRKQSSVGGF